MNGMGSGAIAAGIGAVLFGILYALLVYVPLHGKHAGYTSWLVAIGSAVTLFFFGLAYGWVWSVRAAAFFIATGVPMMLGEAVKAKVDEWKARTRSERRLEGLKVQDDDTQADPE